MKKIILVTLFLLFGYRLAFSQEVTPGTTPTPTVKKQKKSKKSKPPKPKQTQPPTPTQTAPPTMTPTPNKDRLGSTWSSLPTNPIFLINAGYSLVNSYTINGMAVTMTNNGVTTTGSTLTSAPDESEFFVQVMYRDRYPWTKHQSDDFFDLHFNELKFGATLGSGVTNVQSAAAGGDFFGEASFDILGLNSDLGPGIYSRQSLGLLYGASTNKAENLITSYGGLGLIYSVGLLSPVKDKQIEILGSFYPWAIVDEPAFVSQPVAAMDSSFPTVETQNGFYSYAPRQTALLGLEFHCPINDDHFITVEGRYFVKELAASWMGATRFEDPSQLDSWSFQIGLTQNFDGISSIVGSVFNGLAGVNPTATTTPNATVSSSPTDTPGPSPTDTPTATPVNTPAVTPSTISVVTPSATSGT